MTEREVIQRINSHPVSQMVAKHLKSPRSDWPYLIQFLINHLESNQGSPSLVEMLRCHLDKTGVVLLSENLEEEKDVWETIDVLEGALRGMSSQQVGERLADNLVDNLDLVGAHQYPCGKIWGLNSRKGLPSRDSQWATAP